MTATYDVLLRARRLINGPRRDLTTTSVGAVNASATSITVTSATGIAAQSVIEVGMEQMLVTSLVGAVLTVARGYNGTLPASHPAGSYVLVNPTVTMWDLVQAANAEIASLSSPQNGLYRTGFVDISVSTGRLGFDLTGVADGFLGVLAVRYRRSSLLDWVSLRPGGWEVLIQPNSTDFPSGVGIYFPNGIPGAFTTRVHYKAAFNVLSGIGSEDVAATTGLALQAEDIVSLGAAIRAVEGRAVARSDPFTQGDTRRAGEATTTDALQGTSALRRTRAERIAEEAARLRALWGAM